MGYPILLVCRKLLPEHINNKTSLFYPLKARLLSMFYPPTEIGGLSVRVGKVIVGEMEGDRCMNEEAGERGF